MKQTSILSHWVHRSLVFVCLAVAAFACETAVNPNITPTVDLTIAVVDDAFQPVEGATVYLFPFRTPYEEYLAENPDGDPNITPSLSAENIGITNALGEVVFPTRPMEGTSYASGETFIHEPNPVYVRVQAPGNLTNDQGVNRIAFDDAESGDQIAEFVEIQVQ
ncbi:MAG: hypothetical protein AAF399_17360 [Bacteroidota bacterium]